MSELLYDALMLGRNKSVAREEYLVATGRKEPAAFAVRETTVYFSDVMGDTTGFIHIDACAEGYLEIEAYCRDSFIALGSKVITSDDFTGGSFAFPFTVKASGLHNGKNLARIELRTPGKTAQVDITVDNRIRLAFGKKNSKSLYAALCRDYIDLRTGKLFQTEWQEHSLELLKDISGGDARELYLLLYRANVLTMCGEYDEAKSLIEFVSVQMGKLTYKDWKLISYFLYVTSVYEMSDEGTEAAASQIQKIYTEHPSWETLWTWFYVDAELNSSPGRMLRYMEDEFILRGCTSPIMYFEAVECMKLEPQLLKRLDRFSVQALRFAAGEDFLNVNVCMRAAELVWEAGDDELAQLSLGCLINVMEYGYRSFESNLVLKSLVKLIIAADARDEKYHRYIEKAIHEFLETRDIYNYFIYTADHSKAVQLPPAVLEYFIGREATLGADREYFLACVQNGKDIWPDYYRKYAAAIIRYTAESVSAGRTGTSLALLYEAAMKEDALTHELYQKMLEILCTRELVTDNKLVVSALVFHRELGEYQESYLHGGTCQVKLYSPDAVILFKDSTGNLYHNIEYTLREYLPKAEYIDICIRYAPISRYMMIGDQMAMLRAIKEPVTILEYLFSQMGSASLTSAYEQEVLKGLILYFSRTNKDPEVSDRLLHFLDFELDSQTRGKLIEVMIDRRLYNEACRQIEAYGMGSIDTTHISELAHVLAEIADYEEDELLTSLCVRSFTDGDQDPVVFRYLARNYNGETEVLLKMFNAANAFGYPVADIYEKIIRRMLEENKFIPECARAFEQYFDAGDDDLLKDRFIEAVADRYLYEKDTRGEFVFPFMIRRIFARAEFPDRTRVALVLWGRRRQELEASELKAIGDIIEELSRHGIMLEEFKEYKNRLSLPAALTNAYIAETFADKTENADSPQVTRKEIFRGIPKITYTISGHGRVRDGAEAMKEIFRGCYVRYFTLFFGETLTYSIDGETHVTVSYNDLHVERDGSRFSEIDSLIQLEGSAGQRELERAAMEYYVKRKIVENLF